MNLDELRQQIDQLDGQIVQLLRQRARVSLAIGAAKADQGRPIYDPQREAALLERLTAGDLTPLAPASITAIYREIISASRALQRCPVIAYLGPEQTFSHLATRKHFGSACQLVPQTSIEEVFRAVERGNADYGMVPIENSIQGVVTRTLDCFIDSPLLITCEASWDVHICLMSAGDLNGLQQVFSHPQPLAQCRHWLQENLPGVQLISESSTAAAAERAAAGGPATAALGSVEAAQHYGLAVLATNIEDQPNNRTRFFVIGHTQPGPGSHDKTSVLFTTRHEAGALYSALAPLNAHHISLTLLQSRPAPARLEGPYIFYADFVGHESTLQIREALRELREHCLTVKVLGSYPALPE
jgi:chorismate mutase/prephenate dehydratase